MRRKLFLLFLLLRFGAAFAQKTIGLPNIINYSRTDYNGGLQNRSIVQDKNGVIYAANSEGLLSFDGTYWKLYPLPNRYFVRSVAIGKDNRIYVGGQNEIGYFSPNANGILVFTSIRHLLPEKNASFKDIWNIVSLDSQLFFRSQNHIFQFDYKSVTDYRPLVTWGFLGVANNEVYAEDTGTGLYKFGNGKWIPLQIAGMFPKNLAIAAMLPLNKDSVLVATQKGGLFVLAGGRLSTFKFNHVNPFLSQQILSAIRMDEQTFAIGTHMGGVYIIDHHGNIIENLSRREGLQNNTVLGLFSDRDHNLWMGLDDGIDLNARNSAIKHIYPEKLNEGAGYSAQLFKSRLYIGTSNWLYELPVAGIKDLSAASGDFKRIAGTKGSAWGLFDINNKLLLAHHEGAFEIRDDKALPINTHYGYWNFTANDNLFPGYLVAGNYNGIDLVRYDHNAFVSTGNINSSEASHYLITDKNRVWAAHDYEGIFKIDFSIPGRPVSKLYSNHNGLPSPVKNRLFRIKNRMVVATEKGLYEYNAVNDRFEPSAYFKSIFEQKNLRYLKEDDRGNVWFIEEKKLGVVDFSGLKPHVTYFPELNGKLVGDFENIYPLNEQNIFVGAEKGFYHINYSQYKKSKNSINALITAVKVFGNPDSILNGGYVATSPSLKRQLPELTSKQNSLHFEFSAPSFQQQANIEYRFLLKNFDKQWSAWSKRTEKDYTNLPAGHYTFQVIARSNLGNESAVTGYSFIVLPPWYLTWWADVVYGGLFIVFNFQFYRLIKRKFKRQKLKYEEEQKRLNYLHQLELDQSEKEIIALKNEKLESEILGKNSELAAVAMHLLQKGELLTKIREELVHLRKADNDMPSEELKRLIRILNQESKMDKDWDQFASHFDNTNDDFLKAIRDAHPLLSPHELKLCAYLKLNLSSKEIAQLLNISVRGVEISRYRLRKKLALPKEVNIHHYLTKFSLRKKDRI